MGLASDSFPIKTAIHLTVITWAKDYSLAQIKAKVDPTTCSG